MARSPKLKVYRTPIGFHDAYVAASSQKAALAAWGSDRDLFARGIAEVVTDPELTAEPLAEPGTVVRRSRGTAAEQIAALPPAPKAGATPATPHCKRKPASPPPKPDRDALDAAEAALAEGEEQFARERRQLDEAQARQRRELERKQQRDNGRLTEARDSAERAYRKAMAAWRTD